MSQKETDVTFHNETEIKKTRKAHRCAFCGTTIAQGSPAIRWSGKWDGDFFSEIGHPDCVAMWTAAYADWGDPWDGMPYDLVEAVLDGATDAEAADTLNHYRGRFPHPVCRIELRLLQSELRAIADMRKLGFDREDAPEIYA